MPNDLTNNIYIISRCTHNYYAREFRKLGISVGQFSFIMGIAENPGISQEKLSRQLMISKSTTALIVQQLLNNGLITRTIDDKDRRIFNLHPTKKTLDLLPKINGIIERCHETILQDVTPIEGAILLELLKKVRVRTEKEMGRKPFA